MRGRRSDPASGGDARRAVVCDSRRDPSRRRQEQRRPRRAPNQYNIGYYGHASRLAGWPVVETAPRWPGGHQVCASGLGPCANHACIPFTRLGRGKAQTGQQKRGRTISRAIRSHWLTNCPGLSLVTPPRKGVRRTPTRPSYVSSPEVAPSIELTAVLPIRRRSLGMWHTEIARHHEIRHEIREEHL
jgi:hypothetical protein